MKVLSVSDIEIGIIYSPAILQRFGDVGMVISCGDLPYFYLEYIISMLNVPLYYVLGNHQNQPEHHETSEHKTPWGAINLHHRSVYYNDLILAGIQGSLLYNNGPYQYSQAEMWNLVWSLTPALFLNRLRYGRYLDVFVTHAPPWGIHDKEDLPHQGIKAFRWLDQVFQPRYHFHGHIHVYRTDTITETTFAGTQVVNTSGYRVTDLEMAPERRPSNDAAHGVRERSGLHDR